MSITKKFAHIGIQALTIGALLIAMVAPSSASTLNFDSIATPACTAGLGGIDPVGSYGGFTWDANLAVECDADYTTTGPHGFGSANTYGAPSSANAIFNQLGITSVVITRAALFDFDGASVSGWTFGDAVDANFTAHSITIKGYLGGVGGTLKGSETITLETGATALEYLPAGAIAGDIDTLQITTPTTPANDPDGGFWLLDDFQYHDAGTTTVPEPASALLLGSGLVGLIALRRRKNA